MHGVRWKYLSALLSLIIDARIHNAQFHLRFKLRSNHLPKKIFKRLLITLPFKLVISCLLLVPEVLQVLISLHRVRSIYTWSQTSPLPSQISPCTKPFTTIFRASPEKRLKPRFYVLYPSLGTSKVSLIISHANFLSP